MKARFIKFKKLHPLIVFKHMFSKASVDNEGKRKIFGKNPLKLGMKVYSILAVAIIVILLVSVFGFMPKGNKSTPDVPLSTDNPTISSNNTSIPQATHNPTPIPGPFSQITGFFTGIGASVADAFSPPKAPGTIESAGAMNSSVWRQVAANAWNYFQPGVGVDPNTGLPRAGGTDSPNFTDWDLGVYIQAVIDANKTGLIGTDGAWNSSQRLETVVKFLETRELNNASYPYWFYQAKDGKDYHADSDLATSPVDVVDTGRLFVALNNLKAFNSSLIPRIDNIVLHGRSNYAALVPSIKSDSQSSTSIYAYYITCGFESFWPNELSNATTQILNNIRLASNVTTPEGASLPLATILGDPLYCSVFETSNNSQLMTIAKQVYLAHEAYYNATGKYRAFSEGGSLSGPWIYEWVVLPDGRTWTVLDGKGANYTSSPIIYTKTAIGFLALYNTTLAYNMVVYLEKTLPDPAYGYSEGVDESGAQFTSIGSNTNGLIIGAARYAIQNSPK